MTEILTDVDGPVATLTISNPDRRNAITYEASRELSEVVRDFAYDDDVRCMLVRGDPDGGAFCAGADLQTRTEPSADPTARTEAGFHRVAYEIMKAKKPVVSKVTGPAVGAGASMAASADFVYADETARIGWVFSRIGLTLDSGASFILPRIMGIRKAMELAVSGDIVDAETALEYGIVTDVLPEDELDDFVAGRTAELASGPTLAIGEMKRLLLRGDSQALDEALYDESRAASLVGMSEDAAEGREAFLEGRDPDFQGR